MLVGYVSCERYLALPDVLLEFEGKKVSIETRSTATGAVYADVKPGDKYQVTLYRTGSGAKSVEIRPKTKKPQHCRLLANNLVGYTWPKWVRSGERTEYRVHAVEPYRLDLYRYGWKKEHIKTVGWFDEHGPKATMQITPDGDYTQTGATFNKRGYHNNPHHTQFVAGPERSGLYYFHAKAESGAFFSFPWIVAPAKPTAKIAGIASNINWNTSNKVGGRSNYIHPIAMPPKLL